MKLYDELITLEIFEGFEIECALHEISFTKEEIRDFVENEVLNIYKSFEDAKKDITFIEIFEGPVIYFQTHSKDKARYIGYNGNTYRVKSGINSETIKKGLNFFNIVKATCREFGITYRELGESIGYKPDTINKAASTGEVSDQLKKAIEMFIENVKLKKQLQEYEMLKHAIKCAIS